VRRGVYPHLSHSVPRRIPQNQLDGNAPGRTSLDANLAYGLVCVDIFGLSWTPLAPDVAERGGFEPPIRLPVCRISSAVLSTTQPPLQAQGKLSWRPIWAAGRYHARSAATSARTRRPVARRGVRSAQHRRSSPATSSGKFHNIVGLIRQHRRMAGNVDSRRLCAYLTRFARGLTSARLHLRPRRPRP
jgi:hypothetical protein